MEAATTIRRARSRSGLTLRALARRASTSHATLSAYEHGHKVPTVETLDRIVRAAGFRLASDLLPAPSGPLGGDRGRELADVLHLAEQFPARHDPELTFPRFGRAEGSSS